MFKVLIFKSKVFSQDGSEVWLPVTVSQCVFPGTSYLLVNTKFLSGYSEEEAIEQYRQKMRTTSEMKFIPLDEFERKFGCPSET